MSTIWIINQYASTPETGMGGRHHYLARELGKRGHKVYLVTASWHHLLREPLPDPLPETEQGDGYTLVRVPVPRYAHAHDKKRVLNWFLFRWRLRHLIRRIPDRPDVILYSSPGLIPWPGAERLARKLGARLVFEVRDIWPLTLTEVGGVSASHPLIRYMQRIEDRAYRTADAVISNLPYSVDHMVTRGLGRDRFYWISNGYSADEVATPVPLPVTTRAALPDGVFIVGYTGTVGVANALDVMVDAAELLKDRLDIAFVIVGGGRERAHIADMIAEKGLSNIHMVDPIPKGQIQSMLTTFDVCYVGLTPDPLFRFGVSPNKLFDYMIAGKPIIYGIDSGPYHPVEGAGIQIPPGDAAALAEAVHTLAALPSETRESMGQTARDRALEHHEYGALAKRLEQVLLPGTGLD